MKEIEFRAWDGEAMWSFANREWLLLHKDGYSAFDKSPGGNKDVHSNSFEANEWYMMQYIGLKDKNGTKIFEGDIVYLAGYGNCVVEDFGFGLWDAVKSGNSDDIGCILGNIYENPELSEGE